MLGNSWLCWFLHLLAGLGGSTETTGPLPEHIWWNLIGGGGGGRSKVTGLTGRVDEARVHGMGTGR